MPEKSFASERPIYKVHMERSISGGLDVPITLHTDSILSLLQDSYRYEGNVHIKARMIDEQQTANDILSDFLVESLIRYRGTTRQSIFEIMRDLRGVNYADLAITTAFGAKPFKTEWLDLTQAANDYIVNKLRVADLLPKLGGITVLELDIDGPRPLEFAQTVRRNIFDRQCGSNGSIIDMVFYETASLSNQLHNEYIAAQNLN
jgi:hypothetical protein